MSAAALNVVSNVATSTSSYGNIDAIKAGSEIRNIPDEVGNAHQLARSSMIAIAESTKRNIELEKQYYEAVKSRLVKYHEEVEGDEDGSLVSSDNDSSDSDSEGSDISSPKLDVKDGSQKDNSSRESRNKEDSITAASSTTQNHPKHLSFRRTANKVSAMELSSLTTKKTLM